MSSRVPDDELERTLAEVGRRLAYPSGANVSAAVRERIGAPGRAGLLEAFRRHRVLAPAFAVALLLVAIGLASPDVRGAAGEFLRLRGIDIFPVPSVPNVSPSAPVFGGQRMTLDEARRVVRFTLRVPGAPELGAPDDVYVDASGPSDRVTLVYRQRSGIPVSPAAGVSAVIVEFRGSLDDVLLGKATGPGTRIEAVTVNGGRGFWLEGEPHLFFYRDPAGNAQPDTLRLAGNTLVWEQDGLTIRLEAETTKEQALRIASSVR